ncbi:MAG: hypothetical protein WDN31_11615 [Hyphomicrobium sp.]
MISGLYDASSQGADWSAVGRELYQRLGVDSGSLRIVQPDGPVGERLPSFEPDESVYGERFGFIDPIRAAARRCRPQRRLASAVKVNEDLVPDEVLRRSEFFQNFAKPNGQRYTLLAAPATRTTRSLPSFARACRHRPGQSLPRRRAAACPSRRAGEPAAARGGAHRTHGLWRIRGAARRRTGARCQHDGDFHERGGRGHARRPALPDGDRARGQRVSAAACAGWQ